MNKRNQEISDERSAKLNAKPGARVGDFLKLRNGRYVRFSHNWGEDLQTATGGSFYLGNGFCDFSGALYGSIERNLMKQTDEVKKGSVWFFNNNEARAHNGFYTEIDFRVFEIIDAEIETEYLKKSGLEYQFNKKEGF